MDSGALLAGQGTGTIPTVKVAVGVEGEEVGVGGLIAWILLVSAVRVPPLLPLWGSNWVGACHGSKEGRTHHHDEGITVEGKEEEGGRMVRAAVCQALV